MISIDDGERCIGGFPARMETTGKLSLLACGRSAIATILNCTVVARIRESADFCACAPMGPYADGVGDAIPVDSWSDEVVPDGVGDRLRAATELGVDVVDVGAHRVWTDEECLGDPLVALTAGNQS